MTPEAQRIAIAEACGFEDCFNQIPNSIFGKSKWVGYVRFNGQLGEDPEPLPDYLNDLNACAVFENAMDDDTYNKWSHNLTALRNDECLGKSCRCRSASASQRCKALLLTIEKWKE